MDGKDRKILYALDFHGRDPVSRIAKKLRMSEDTASYRIKRLEKAGVIKSYYLVPDTTKLGLVSYKIMLKYQNTNAEVEQEIVDYLKAADEVGWLVRTEGHYDVMFISWVKNEFLFDAFFMKFLDRFGQYFYLRDMVIITENHACRKAYLSSERNARKDEVFYVGEPKNICDDTDLRIIDLLMKDARMQTTEIARRVGLTPEAIGYRLRQLRKRGVVVAFRPRIDLNRIGYYYYNVLFRLNKTSAIPRLFSYARQNPNVTYFVRYVGAYDVGFDIDAESPERFREILTEIRGLFASEINNYNYVLVYDEVKITY